MKKPPRNIRTTMSTCYSLLLTGTCLSGALRISTPHIFALYLRIMAALEQSPLPRDKFNGSINRAEFEGIVRNWLLEELAVSMGEHDVEIGRLREGIAPALDFDVHAVSLGQRHDLLHRGDATSHCRVDAQMGPAVGLGHVFEQ